MQPNFDTSLGFRYGSVPYQYGSGTSSFNVENLDPNSDYYIYFVLQGSYAEPSFVYCYRFSTTNVVSPVLTARAMVAAQSTT